jgi:hypothetical protein
LCFSTSTLTKYFGNSDKYIFRSKIWKDLKSTKEVFVEKRRNKCKKKIKRKIDFDVYPVMKINFSHPPRLAMVYWGKGRPKEYRLDYLSNLELKTFWQMSKLEKAEYLAKLFNRHHRLPRCQDGITEPSNLSYVDIVSHVSYNCLISITARWSSLPVEKVRTTHLEQFLHQFYQSFEKLFVCDEKVKRIESVLFDVNMSDLSPHFIGNIARWAHLDYKFVHVSNVHLFIERIYPPIRRLAYDYQNDKLRSLATFIGSLNQIWLPRDEQMIIRQ